MKKPQMATYEVISSDAPIATVDSMSLSKVEQQTQTESFSWCKGVVSLPLIGFGMSLFLQVTPLIENVKKLTVEPVLGSLLPGATHVHIVI